MLKQSTRVEPEPRAPEPDPNAVFGVPLSRLKEAGKLHHGVPLVLKNMVEFLERYGEFSCVTISPLFQICQTAKTFRHWALKAEVASASWLGCDCIAC